MSSFSLLEDLLNGQEKVEFKNESISVEKLRELEKASKGGVGDKLNDIVLIWDDMIQFTTLGLIDILMDLHEIKDELDINLFLYRGLAYTDGIDFVLFLFEEVFKVPLEREYIQSIKRKNYTEILKRSPVTTMFASLVRSEMMIKSLKVVFKYKFNGMDDFINSFWDHFSGVNKFPLSYDTLYDRDLSLYLNDITDEFDSVFAVNLGDVFIHIEESDHRNISMVGPAVHNGIPEDILALYYGIFGNLKKGPLNSELVLFNEGFALC